MNFKEAEIQFIANRDCRSYGFEMEVLTAFYSEIEQLQAELDSCNRISKGRAEQRDSIIIENQNLHNELAKAKPVLDAAMNYAQAEGWLDKSKNIEHCGTEGCFHCELGLAVRKFKEE